MLEDIMKHKYNQLEPANNNKIMEICKAPTLQLKALNKHSYDSITITHIMYIEMENVLLKKKPPKKHIHTHNVDIQ